VQYITISKLARSMKQYCADWGEPGLFFFTATFYSFFP